MPSAPSFISFFAVFGLSIVHGYIFILCSWTFSIIFWFTNLCLGNIASARASNANFSGFMGWHENIAPVSMFSFRVFIFLRLPW